MISVLEATKIVLSNKLQLREAQVPLYEAYGKILREALIADRDFPPYNRVTMDGIALLYSAFESGCRQFPIQSIAPAGAPQQKLETENHCIEVMTGSILPDNTDAVIRYEDLVIADGVATVKLDKLKLRQNIHEKGEDRKAGDCIVAPGKLLGAPEIGVAATIGKTSLKVTGFPKAIIISTGDELVEIDQKPLAHQIRKSNVHRLKAMLRHWGLEVDTAHLQDDEQEIQEKMENILNDYPVVLLSGGVSKGKFDFIPKVLEQLGVKKLFHRIKQRPGKPFWFGRTDHGAVVFALPGNPVSSFMCTLRYFKPWLKASLGMDLTNQPYAILEKDVTFNPELTYFVQVKTHFNQDGTIRAIPVEGRGSGDLANLVDADAFLELPPHKNTFCKGEIYPLLIYR